MAISRRQQIIAAVNTQLKTIKIDDGYKTDLGLNVFWDRDTDNKPLEEKEYPCIVVEVADAEMDPIAFQAEMHGLILTLKCYSLPTKQTGLDPIKDGLRSDVIQAMYKSGDHIWGGLADDTRHTGETSYEETHNKRKVHGVELEYTIDYQTAIGDPYNLPS